VIATVHYLFGSYFTEFGDCRSDGSEKLIFIFCDALKASTSNNSQVSINYSFAPSRSPGYLLAEIKKNISTGSLQSDL
jgi:hypothetical protein